MTLLDWRLKRRKLLGGFGYLWGFGALGSAWGLSGCTDDDDESEADSGASFPPEEAEPSVFRHGVASGEPLPSAVVLWTRVTPTADALPGSGLGDATPVRWQCASDPDFNDVVAAGEVMSSADRDHTIHIDVQRLDPARHYWYRFAALDVASVTGRTRTAPAADAQPEAVRFGLVTCAEWEFGFFAAYRHLAEQDNLDAVLHMGDYIYEFGNDYGPVATPGAGFGRVHEPPHEIVSLADYRTRYGQYRSDPDLQTLHAKHPFITIYDDHEVTNDWWREGAENHDASEGDYFERLSGALRAWREWQPLRQFAADDPLRAWRRMAFGDLVDLWLLDTRLYRDQQPTNAIVGYGSIDPAADDPNRSLLGAEQRSWLYEGLRGSTAAWKVLGNQIPFYTFATGSELPALLGPALEPFHGQLPPLPAPLTVEDWNGYRAEQRGLLEVLAEVDDAIVLTGDYHESFATEVPQLPGSYRLDGNSVAVEFICPSVTSPGLSDTLGGLGLPASNLIDTVFELNLTLANPWVKYHEGFANGFAVVEFGRERTQYDFWHIVDRSDPDTTAQVVASWQVPRGSSTLQSAAEPLASTSNSVAVA